MSDDFDLENAPPFDPELPALKEGRLPTLEEAVDDFLAAHFRDGSKANHPKYFHSIPAPAIYQLHLARLRHKTATAQLTADDLRWAAMIVETHALIEDDTDLLYTANRLMTAARALGA